MDSNRKTRGEFILRNCLKHGSLDEVVRYAINERNLVFLEKGVGDVMKDSSIWVSKEKSTVERALSYLEDRESKRFVISEFPQGGIYGLFPWNYTP